MSHDAHSRRIILTILPWRQSPKSAATARLRRLYLHILDNCELLVSRSEVNPSSPLSPLNGEPPYSHARLQLWGSGMSHLPDRRTQRRVGFRRLAEAVQ